MVWGFPHENASFGEGRKITVVVKTSEVGKDQVMSSLERYICVHGHFYQPPRENPWLESVEVQDSATPYHDWNERICTECYAPNGASRIVNPKNQIIRIVNNYSRMNFNFGPTLLSWLEENAPRTYRMLLDGEARSAQTYGGHSSAMAQVYNHIIMPLANTRDKITQIRWGIADYEHRFGHPPEGMWLAETAVDNETLELLAMHGIAFTVLAPHQCARVRPLAAASLEWRDTPDASVDTTHPYLVRFPSGLSITVFFYDGPRSRAIAFEGLLNSGEYLAQRLAQGFRSNVSGSQLVHVATDGETYGHHHRHGEMALSYAFRYIERQKLAKLTNYGEFLAKFPPKFEAEVHENSSWSCAHGVERWRSDCGCNGGRAGWNQKWRTPLRQGLDELRDAISLLIEERGRTLFQDVWEARNAYIHVLLNRKKESVDRFFSEHATHELSQEERTAALRLMELGRQMQLMYTSCGWFFDDISGIETVQIIAYAARALQLASVLFGDRAAGLENAFLRCLSEAKSNVSERGDGAQIFTEQVKAMQLNLKRIAAHYAICSVFNPYPEEAPLFVFNVRRLSHQIFSSGRGRLALGRIQVTSLVTEWKETFSFAVLHFGDQNINAAVRPHSLSEDEAFDSLAVDLERAVNSADFPRVVRLLDSYFGHLDFSLTSLFADDQRRIVQLILNSTLSEVENGLRAIYEDHASLLHFLSEAGLPRPPALSLAAGFAINAGLRHVLEAETIDVAQLRSLLKLAKADRVTFDTHVLSYLVDLRMKRAMVELQLKPTEDEILNKAIETAYALRELPFELNLWQAQNIWYDILRSSLQLLSELSEEDGLRWKQKFEELGVCLSISVAELIVEIDAAAHKLQTPGEK
jgi:alpha-amylase/alpha-mannosidase (GH57 family)